VKDVRKDALPIAATGGSRPQERNLSVSGRHTRASELQKTVAAIIPDWPSVDAAVRMDVAIRCANLVLEQISRAPFYSRIGFKGLFILFRIFRRLKTVCKSPEALREHTLHAFSSLPIPMAGTLERVLRSTTLLFYFEQPEVLTAVGEETISARQATYRAKRQLELAR
jgi:hypothetical protein